MPLLDESALIEGDRFRVKHNLKIISKTLWGKEGVIIKWEYNDMYFVKFVDSECTRRCLLRACEMEKINV